MKTKKREFETHTEYGYYEGSKFIYHREDGPAVEFSNGNRSWWLNGKLHRDDGPAVEYANGIKYWYKNGEFKEKID
jgi:hypothetical protein